MKNIRELLSELAAEAKSTRSKGELFERLVARYLRHDPLYFGRFSEVFIWNEWPKRRGADTGIDIVAKERDGNGYCAVQCKFYEPGHTLQKSDIDSFFTASGKAPFISRIIFSTSDKWSSHAEDALIGQQIPVCRVTIHDLEASSIDWQACGVDVPLVMHAERKIRPHQQKAIEEIMQGFETAHRGKLIMACGTGKTYTSLCIARELIAKKPHHSTVVFLAPSIALVSQTLREWASCCSMRSFVVCSDTSVGRRKESEDLRPYDLAYPPTTRADILARELGMASDENLTVIFATYQSIQVLSDAQNIFGAAKFDLIVCDEAHRTTGVTLAGDDESHFVKVHSDEFIKAEKRLYMTATPRIYADNTKEEARAADAVLCSMDNELLYGEELHRLGFGEAVEKNLLADYKVMVLAVDENYVMKSFQNFITDTDNELNLSDTVKMIGCWSGLNKRGTSGIGDDTAPMSRAVAFSRSIRDSKRASADFPDIAEICRNNAEDIPVCNMRHVDGTMNVCDRNTMLDWLKEDAPGECRILSNARCLSEGVDVPALDAVIFLNPRDSMVDVIQSVGRVMRRSPGKKYGYIILPVGIPAGMTPEEALKDNKKYEIVWKVLQALRAHDDRFNAMVNKLELNKNEPAEIVIGKIPLEDMDDGVTPPQDKKGSQDGRFNFDDFYGIAEWKDAIYAKLVQKCGDRRYWEDWAGDIAEIASRYIRIITEVLQSGAPEHKAAFHSFLGDLQNNINPGISKEDAIEMLAQHKITKPVFDALFENYSFAMSNPVSVAMESILCSLDAIGLHKETETLEKFYKSVRVRAEGIDNAEGRQHIIKELYDKFFKNAFPRMSERLGIVYTPVEVVDFIIRTADGVLSEEFGLSIGDRGVHVIDPFTGTGTFIARILQSGLLKDMSHKYKTELHANEIVLLAYYIAAINIEETYHHITGGGYVPFDGIVLTDTFNAGKSSGDFKGPMEVNSSRLEAQRRAPITVIVGNPPYSAGQRNQNEDNQNVKYKELDGRIRDTYARYSSGINKNSLYDSYIRAIRWASDRIGDKGVVCFVTNGGWIDGNAQDGMRKCIADEFTGVYCLNLRGNQRTSGEQSRKEGGKIFGSGSRAGIAITLFIKNPQKRGCRILYYDIGDYLSRDDKLKFLTENTHADIPWTDITPSPKHDWINHRDEEFDKFMPIGSKDNANEDETQIFGLYSSGVKTNRDAWVYNFSNEKLCANMGRMVDKYNEEVELSQNHGYETCYDSQLIKWNRGLLNDLKKTKKHKFIVRNVVAATYRPYCKENMYFDANFNDMVYQMPKIFPAEGMENMAICVTGIGASKDFSALICNVIPNLHTMDTGQCFPFYRYEKAKESSLFDDGGYQRHENIGDTTLRAFQNYYDNGSEITKEDIFYYVYGLLHSPEYRERYASDLKKGLPRIPYAGDFWAFSGAGRNLAHLHMNYESVTPYGDTPPVPEDADMHRYYRVEKMRFAQKSKEPGSIAHKRTIIYNQRLAVENIPLRAYDYVVNGKPAIAWIMERYQITTDKDSQIHNDPNMWSHEHKNPSYIYDLLRRIISLSLQTMDIIDTLPSLEV